tara:strand:- start:97 stop:411 length:315 start_codon:yes stop_codon:yes gene_type:complete
MCTRISYFCDWINYNFLYLHDIIEYKLKKMNNFFNNDNNDNKKSTKNSMDSMDSMYSMDSIVIDKIKTNNIKIKIIDTDALNYDIHVNPISKPPSPSSPGWDII